MCSFKDAFDFIRLPHTSHSNCPSGLCTAIWLLSIAPFPNDLWQIWHLCLSGKWTRFLCFIMWTLRAKTMGHSVHLMSNDFLSCARVTCSFSCVLPPYPLPQRSHTNLLVGGRPCSLLSCLSRWLQKILHWFLNLKRPNAELVIMLGA